MHASLKAALFDLGNTLVSYYTREEFPQVLGRSLSAVRGRLAGMGLVRVTAREAWRRAQDEGREADDCRVRPLIGRLSRVFGLSEQELDDAQRDALCRAFLAPIFALGQVYDDVPDTLAALRARGVRTAIVSNTPWGSPAYLWHEEVARLGLADMVDAVVFCGDVGWRKPARPIFGHALALLGLRAEDCVFAGDDSRWDVAGPLAVGMKAVLVDRAGHEAAAEVPVIRGLHELPGLVFGG